MNIGIIGRGVWVIVIFLSLFLCLLLGLFSCGVFGGILGIGFDFIILVIKIARVTLFLFIALFYFAMSHHSIYYFI